jgi:hypothetical protein
MASNQLLKAKVKATGKDVEVYKATEGCFIDFSDCKTKYQANEIQLK